MMHFGIDFGTTNSACVGIEDGRRLIKFTDGYGNPFPSIVIIDRATGQVYCGREAWRRREELRGSCEIITSVKTLLDSGRVWNIAGRVWTPEMVAAQVLAALKRRVSERLGEQDALREAVVAVPVGFPAGKRAALRKAAHHAGIEIKSFVSEPTAALFCHYEEVGHCVRVGVFDWGGGTLDVSVIENRNGRVKEIATAGLDKAGDHIDRLLAEWMHNRIMSEAGRKVSFDQMAPEARDKMLAACEQAKKDLTWDDLVEIQIVNYGDVRFVHEDVEFGKFSQLIGPVVDQAVQCFEDCVRRAGMSIDQLDCILMVGGSVNLRPLSERIARSWRGKEFYPPESEWSVAHGAASLSVSPGVHTLAQTLGVVMSDGTLYPLLREGEPAVAGERASAVFALVEDDPAASLVFADGSGGTLGYLNVPSFGFFREKIEVCAEIDRDLILHIQARSMNRSARTTREWVYNGLRVNYQLPVTRLEVADGG